MLFRQEDIGPPSAYPFSRGQMTVRDRKIAALLW
jgi:hypothetical protein